MEFELDVADGVREIEADGGADGVAGLGDRPHREDLARVVLHPGQQDQRQLVTVLCDRREDVVAT